MQKLNIHSISSNQICINSYTAARINERNEREYFSQSMIKESCAEVEKQYHEESNVLLWSGL